VHMPGGMIDIEIKKDGHIYMMGAVSGVAKGEFFEEMRELLK
jgi:diaminopimelate epimerase